MTGPFNDRLQCRVELVLQCRVELVVYDYGAKAGRLYLAADECCDMAGCIGLFTAIDPDVRHIETTAGDDPDTVYQLVAGMWKAFEPGKEPHHAT